MGEAPRFVVDENLGRLARWLRVAGFDALHRNPADDAWLLRTARAEGRLLLTRDRKLLDPRRLAPPLRAEAGSARIRLVEGFDTREQLLEVCRALGLDPLERAFRRCPLCNDPLEAIDRERARGTVPERSLALYAEFFRCPACRKVYWEGDHVARSRRLLEGVRRRVGGGVGDRSGSPCAPRRSQGLPPAGDALHPGRGGGATGAPDPG
ncbi:MAG: Mut7-C RNAse domain-containing protein [Planctomycetes bacterium]|nr:Mut7-C RNAse domain-containing protein [Planctomycetota bacterium]